MKTTSIKLALAALAALVSAPAFAADEVQLEEAYKIDINCGISFSCHNYRQYLAIKTKAMGTNENVKIHYTTDGRTWRDIAAIRTIKGNGSSKWELPFASLSSPDQPTSNKKFAIKYTANGKSYWDNNGGKNYLFGEFVFKRAIKISALDSGLYMTGDCGNKKISLSGNMAVRHLGNPKKVGIKYTFDNWATSQTVDASYYYPNPGSSTDNTDIEVWWLSTPDYSPTKNRMEYVAYYTVNGKTYWDNNYGLNYKTSCSDYDINWKYRY